MASQKEKLHGFTANVRLNLEIGVDIQAKSLEEALQKANSLGIEDIVTVHGDLQESASRIHSIWDNKYDIEDVVLK